MTARRIAAGLVIVVGLLAAFGLLAQQWYVDGNFLCGRPLDVALFGLRRSGGELVQPPSRNAGLCRGTSIAWTALAAGILTATAGAALVLLRPRRSRT